MSLNNFNLLAGAIIEGDLSKVRELFHEDAIKAIGSYGETLLHYAAFYDKLDIARFLIEYGINISVRNKGGELPVDLANRLGKTGIANFLRTKQSEYDSQLLTAVYYGDVNQVTDLLDRGANILAEDQNGKTPLDVANEFGRFEILRLLINQAIEQDKLDLVKPFLIRSAKKVDVPDDDRWRTTWTLLDFVAYNGNLDIVQDILKLPAEKMGDINHAESHYGCTPLFWALYYHRSDLVKPFIDLDAGIDHVDKLGRISLDIAKESGDFKALRLIINQAIEQDKLDLGKIYPENIGLQPRSARSAQRVCRRPIKSGNFSERVASFFSDNEELIFRIYDDREKIIYDNKLYTSSGSKEFGSSPSIGVVLPKEFTFRYGYINSTVRHDGLSQQEQGQVQKDTKAAYDIFKEKFCFAENVEQRDLTYYIFNNRADFQKYNDLLGIKSDRAIGVTSGDRSKVLTFKEDDMDDTLAHEITHVLQDKFAPLAIKRFASKIPEVIPYFIGEKVGKLNNETMQAAKSSSEAENGRRSRRSIDQSHIEPPFSTNSDNQALAPNTTRALPSLNLESKIKNNQATSGASKPSSWINIFAHTTVNAVKGISQFISSPFKPAIDMKHSQPSKAITAQGIDTNGTLLLLDVFIRKITGQKYISNDIRSISEQEAQIYALPIAKEFEQALESAAIESGIPVTNLKFNPVEVFLKVAGQIRSGKFSEISKTLYSSAKEACPEFEQTGEFLVHVKSHLEEFLAKKETVFLQQKQTADQPTSSVSRKVVAMEPSKKPDTFLEPV